jgi:hypothetical protein
MQSTGRVVLILAFLAAALVGVSTFTKHWRSAQLHTRELNVGLNRWEECGHDGCESASWGDVKGKAGRSTAATIGPITFFVGLGATLVLALLAGAPLVAPRGARTLGSIALLFSIAFLGLGVMYALSFPDGFAPVGYSAFLGWLGGVLGIAAGAFGRRAVSRTV